jgi:dTDP-4-dehydrorhamnose reductase
MAPVMDGEKFLITGASGQLGFELHQQLSVTEQSLPKTRDSLNITSAEWVFKWLKAMQPDAIINCAGYTNVARAEVDRADCWCANVCGVNNLACCASRLDIPIIHISTDFVFGQGQQRHPYKESDPIAPINFYGMSKAQGEHALLQWAADRNTPWWIIRCAGLFERPWRYRSNFPNAIMQTLQNRGQKAVPVVSDVRTNLTYAPHLAKAIIWMLAHRSSVPNGIYHITNQGECSWYEAAVAVAKHTQFANKLRPVSREVYAFAQRRDPHLSPRYTCLSQERYQKLGGPEMPTWQDALESWNGVGRRGDAKEAKFV